MQKPPMPVKTQKREVTFEISKMTVVAKIEATPPTTLYYIVNVR